MLLDSRFKQFIFLDTDTIFVHDLIHDLRSDVISAKVVDFANPPISVLEEVMRAAGFNTMPKECRVDASEDRTYFANSNGGLYSIPKQFADGLFESWRRWSLWLLANPEPLQRVNKTAHVDQISFCMAIHDTGLPFEFIPSNLNYFVHVVGQHYYYNSTKPISLLHYHNNSLNLAGLLDPGGVVTHKEKEAIAQANLQIAGHFKNKLFWEMRYANFSDRGSGVGSRGENSSTSEVSCWSRERRKYDQCSMSAAATLKLSGRSTSPGTSGSISRRRHWRLQSTPARIGRFFRRPP